MRQREPLLRHDATKKAPRWGALVFVFNDRRISLAGRCSSPGLDQSVVLSPWFTLVLLLLPVETDRLWLADVL